MVFSKKPRGWRAPGRKPEIPCAGKATPEKNLFCARHIWYIIINRIRVSETGCGERGGEPHNSPGELENEKGTTFLPERASTSW